MLLLRENGRRIEFFFESGSGPDPVFALFLFFFFFFEAEGALGVLRFNQKTFRSGFAPALRSAAARFCKAARPKQAVCDEPADRGGGLWRGLNILAAQ